MYTGEDQIKYRSGAYAINFEKSLLYSPAAKEFQPPKQIWGNCFFFFCLYNSLFCRTLVLFAFSKIDRVKCYAEAFHKQEIKIFRLYWIMEVPRLKTIWATAHLWTLKTTELVTYVKDHVLRSKSLSRSFYRIVNCSMLKFLQVSLRQFCPQRRFLWGNKRAIWHALKTEVRGSLNTCIMKLSSGACHFFLCCKIWMQPKLVEFQWNLSAP